MQSTEPETQTMKVTEALEPWRQVLKDVSRGKKRVVLEDAGVPIAAIISADDLRRLRRYDAQREEDFKVLDRISAAFADVPDEELEREIEKALAEVRAEMRAEREQAARSA